MKFTVYLMQPVVEWEVEANSKKEAIAQCDTGPFDIDYADGPFIYHVEEEEDNESA